MTETHTKVTRQRVDEAFTELRKRLREIPGGDYAAIRQAIGEAEAVAEDMKRWLPADVVPLKPEGS